MTRAGIATIALFTMISSHTARAQTGISEHVIKLGMVNAQTGPASALGRDMGAGASVVFDHVNQLGGIHGRKIQLLSADDGYEPERTIDETLNMIEENQVFALFGYVGTPTSNAIVPIARELNVPLIGLFTGAESLRSPVTTQLFNIRSSYYDEAEALVNHFVEKGSKSIGVFYQNDGFGKAVLAGTKLALKKRKMKVHVTGTFKRNSIAVKSGLSKLLKNPPDAVIMVGPYTPLAAFTKEARNSGLDVPMATVSFVGTQNFASEIGAAGNGIIISQVMPSPDNLDIPAVNTCRKLLDEKKKQTLNYVNLEGCISAQVMAKALEHAGENLSRDKLIQSLEQMGPIDLGGIVAEYSTSDHQGVDQVFLTELRNGTAIQLD